MNEDDNFADDGQPAPESSMSSDRGDRQSFLQLTRELATLPLEQSAAALETGAAVAVVSLRAGIEFRCFAGSLQNPGSRRAA